MFEGGCLEVLPEFHNTYFFRREGGLIRAQSRPGKKQLKAADFLVQKKIWPGSVETPQIYKATQV